MRKLERLCERLDHRFRRIGLLREALTHPSSDGARRGRAGRNYDRLEFLGDRVLGVVIAEHLFEHFPDADAGHMARRYNALVRRETLADVARAIDLGDHLILSASERETGEADKPAILADACEAVIAAIYLDGGIEAARQFVLAHWAGLAADLTTAPKDAKTELQEWAHRAACPPPRYVTVVEEGPAHEPFFTIEVQIEGRPPTRGSGPSKRVAEQAAAGAMLEQVR